MKQIAVVMMFGAAACTAFGEVVYENDFSTRTSAGAVPYGEWREVPYAVGKLVNDAANVNPFSASAATDFQDNWVKALSALAMVVDSDGNPEARLIKNPSESGTSDNIVARHRIGNTFTSGVVKVQCDLKAPKPKPDSWINNGTRSVRLLVGDENFFSPGNPYEYLEYLAGGVGISCSTLSDVAGLRFFRYGYATADLNDGGYDTDPRPLNHWHRAVITANLDTKKYSVAVYDMGNDHPAFDAETPVAAVWTEDNIDFWCVTKGRSAAFTGISTISIAGYSVAGTTSADDIDKTARFDNLRVWHNDVECYQNDFSSRRSCVLGGTTSAVYVAATTPATNSYAYTNKTVILQSRTSAAYQPIGFDGWRRLNNADTSTSIPSVTIYTNNQAMLFSKSKTGNGIAAQPLGQTLTGGKVRMTADVYIDTFGSAEKTLSYADILLGGETLYSGSNSGNAYNNGLFARVGVTAGNDGTTDESGALKRFPRWAVSNDGQGTGRKMEYATSGAATANKWFRLEILANLETGKYDFKIYNVCPSTQSPAYGAAAGEVLYEKSNIYAYQGQSEISTIALSTYAAIAYFDNVCVWHQPAGADAETLVYSNDFSTRKLIGFDGREDKLVGTLSRDPVGIDGWTRLGKDTDDYFLVGGENPALGFETVGSTAAYAAHDLGGLFKSGTMTASFDMHAPSAFASGGYAVVWFGGDRFHESNLTGVADFYKSAAFGVGLDNNRFAAYNGNGDGSGSFSSNKGSATPNHWYRFVVKSEIKSGNSDVAVFDMGTSQPTLATATPAAESAVATFSAMPFRMVPSSIGGISCFAVVVKSVKTASPLASDDSRLLIDNIRVERKREGLLLLIK